MHYIVLNIFKFYYIADYLMFVFILVKENLPVPYNIGSTSFYMEIHL